jgi:hypothetical protein
MAEIERRSRRIDEGTAELIPVGQVFEELEREIG